MPTPSRHVTLLNAPITTAQTAAPGTPATGFSSAEQIMLEAIFTYGSGGTTAKAWVQTSLDGGATWFDIANFAFTTSSASKVSVCVLNPATPLAAGTTPGSAALADNTVLNGVIGDQFRTLVTTTGTYAGGTSLAVHAVVKGG